MIEVERQFQPKPEELTQLLKRAQFDGEVENEDTYYDFPDFSFLKNGTRLRKRNNTYELKIKKVDSSGKLDHSEEIEDETEILKRLGLEAGKSLPEIIAEKMQVLCSFKTKRKKYLKDGFIIDVDETDFGYNITEIELQVAQEPEVQAAKEKIVTFAAQFGLEVKKMPGKVAECLKVTKPEIYKEFFAEKSMSREVGGIR